MKELMDIKIEELEKSLALESEIEETEEAERRIERLEYAKAWMFINENNKKD